MTGDQGFRHQTALVESHSIGAGTRIWAFTHIMAGARIGERCNICDHCFVEAGAVIGNNVTLKNGVSVWDQITLEDGVFVGPNATFTNDRRPRSGNPNWQVERTVIGRGASIGANATILCGIRVGASVARKRLVRPQATKKIAGVCAGFAEQTTLEATA